MLKAYGLTGGIGMGKSVAGRLLAQRGIPVVDTDDLAHQLVEPGQPALEEICAAFGNQLKDAQGRLKRGDLARLVFADATARRRLEAILHPKIRAAWQAQMDAWRHSGETRAVVTIPLLFETSALTAFDEVICVACTERTQRRRLAERGWDAKQIEQRLASQWPVAKKIELSHRVVWTEGDMESHEAQLKRIFG